MFRYKLFHYIKNSFKNIILYFEMNLAAIK